MGLKLKKYVIGVTLSTTSIIDKTLWTEYLTVDFYGVAFHC